MNAGRQRRETYSRLSSRLAQLDTPELCSLLDAGAAGGPPRRSRVLELGGCGVFVKRVPVTDAELDNGFSTANLYGLPTYYNYGIGSVGFGPFRELAAHLRTTGWVLGGEIENFPLLYHHRIVPFAGERAAVDPDRHRRYVEYWGGDENIGRYVLDRARAGHELVLFLEHVPSALGAWLLRHPGRVPRVLEDLRATIDFLRKNGVVHFDAHFENVLTDGGRSYLGDFGLVLDGEFALNGAEREFLEAHAYYDYGQVLWGLGLLLHDMYLALPEEARLRVDGWCGIEAGCPARAVPRILVDHVEEIHAGGVMGLNQGHVDCLLRYRGVIVVMHDFHSAIRRSPGKDTPFPRDELLRLLRETGFVADAGAERA